MSVLSFALAALQAVQPVAPPAPPAPPPPPIVAPREAWPAPQRLRMVRAPDWADYRTYPEVARRLNQEGVVTVEVLVGTDGAPRDCRILISSSHAELDAGTCEVMRQIRFEPARDAEGKRAEASYQTRLRWVLDDPVTFAAARMTAELTLDEGRVTDCRLTREGAVPGAWTRVACVTFAHQAAYYLGDARLSARRATIDVALLPDGAVSEAVAPPGRPVASRRTLFELSDDGDARNCRTPTDRGFGSPRVDHVTPCGFFLSRAWLVPGSQEEDPDSGTFALDVYVEAGE